MARPRLQWVRLLPAAALLAGACRPAPPTPQPVSTAALTQDAQAPMQVTYNPLTGRPSFIRGRIPLSALGLPPSDTSQAVGRAFMKRYTSVFGIDTTIQGLRFVESRTDSLGMRHLLMQQTVQGVPVYAASVSFHLVPQGGLIAAVSSNAVANVRVARTQPAISEDSARALAASQLGRGTPVSSQLVVYPGRQRAADATLAWIVLVRGDTIRLREGGADSLLARRDYVVDAQSGRLLDVLDRLYIARNRQTYDAGHGTSLPGTLRRGEGAPPTGDQDVDHAHDFVGETYDYFAATHGRDSYDGAGAPLIASVHYSVNFENAFWDGTQMVYGDGFPVRDVTAHELTHAVTERTANLEYRYQSGALNESFSDIFGAMVDRDDWLMGEDLPIGAIRDLEHPASFGQPETLSGWVATCSDNEGVHTNSGIPNKAFVNVVAAIGKGDAERIFYRALTVYLQPQSTLEDARAAALQAAEDLFGASSPQLQAVESGFNAVGLDGTAQPPTNTCLPFPVPADLSLLAVAILVALIVVAMAWRGRRGEARG